MKLVFSLFVVCVFLAVGASAQVGGAVISGEPHSLSFPSHTERATYTGMSQSQDLMEHSGSIAVHGERPLWEVMPPSAPGTPLGDLARDIRKEHAKAKKAVIVWNN